MIKTLKRIHLSDCALKSDQLIALAEVIPEMDSIAHISFLQNPELTKLADASTEETQEEASALYAALLAAARLSPHLVAVDIDVPTERNGEVVKALAKQIIAYCLRNMEQLPLSNGGMALGGVKDPEYPDVLQHLVGHDVMEADGPEDEEVTPDDDYIVGGTGVAKALACCLDNRGDEERRLSGELMRDAETGVVMSSAGKAKDASKLLLFSARKIRHRLDPALNKAKALADRSTEERAIYRKFHVQIHRGCKLALTMSQTVSCSCRKRSMASSSASKTSSPKREKAQTVQSPCLPQTILWKRSPLAFPCHRLRENANLPPAFPTAKRILISSRSAICPGSRPIFLCPHSRSIAKRAMPFARGTNSGLDGSSQTSSTNSWLRLVSMKWKNHQS